MRASVSNVKRSSFRSAGGNYQPSPILGIEIPKNGSKIRLLGVPTVIDRMLQQAAGQILCNHYDMEFEENSYGFRPNRNAQQAVMRSLEYINGGNSWIVDMDLKNFFDEVDHCLLLQILYRRIKCVQTLRLIRKWLRTPMLTGGKLVKRRNGVPQGSPLSPILSNILLNELDVTLEKWGMKYVRYADDFSLYFADGEEARRAGNRVYLYLRDKLHLPINRSKSGIRRPEDFTTLGYGFIPSWKKDDATPYYPMASAKSLKTFKQKLKAITRKTTPWTFDTRINKLREVQRG